MVLGWSLTLLRVTQPCKAAGELKETLSSQTFVVFNLSQSCNSQRPLGTTVSGVLWAKS